MKASGTIAGWLVPAILSLSAAHAANTILWDDVPKKLGHGKMRSDGREDRQYLVVTKDGQAHVGYKLIFRANEITLGDGGQSYSRDQVKEIHIRHDGRWSDALLAPASAPFRNDQTGIGAAIWLCTPLALIGVPVLLGITAAAAPIVLSIHVIKKTLPDRVIQIAP